MTTAKIGLLTGPVGIGKTTVAQRTAELARERGLACGGLVTPALKSDQGLKVGIWGLDLRTGERRILARTGVDFGGPGVGPYSFDEAALSWAVGVVDNAIGNCDLLIVDEIGKLELWQGVGLAPVVGRLAGGEAGWSLVLVRDFLLVELQERLAPVEQVVYRATRQNREELPSRIVASLKR